ncbi:cytochrome b/b6 domain-containing protein [Moritella sp. F3]|uniref:cytochrome b/b6 domain-containing protein n=1 Tax=Moritella sp. F3 TaxID=2718882 RepID=UPI0018E10F0F|nr:cytochrome b/b6 domain-containing protein [Moritella sp. F3]GIC78848.1 hydrogenase [Moritella sp. F1]GIC81917.1 hydrogenase [Moritella sp. F3]
MKIWDLPTRLYHWLQAILFMALIITGYNGEGPHIQLGLGLFTLVMWRIVWGIVGSETNRFKQFVRSPKFMWQYFRGQEEQSVGHNPAGGWMVVSLLLCLLLQCISGLVLAGFADSLPLAELWLTDWLFDIFSLIHDWLFYVLPLLIFMHVSAIIGYKLCDKPLLLAMFTGYQAKYTAISIRFESNLKALLVLIVTVFVTIALVTRS